MVINTEHCVSLVNLSMQINYSGNQSEWNCHTNTVTGKCLFPKEPWIREFSPDNPRYGREHHFCGLFFLIINDLRNLQTNQTPWVILKGFPPDKHWNLSISVRRKTENGLDVWFPKQVSIHGPPVDFWYVRNESLRITNNYFYWKNDAHQLIFLPLDRKSVV